MSGRLQHLLDTNVLSETRKKRADERVLAFLSSAEPSAMFLSVLSLGERRRGVARKSHADPDAAKRLGAWVDGLECSFADRILGVDAAMARRWVEASARRPRPVVDTLLAATALVHKLTLVTRKLSDGDAISS